MTLINLTEEYLKTPQRSLMYSIFVRFVPHLYYASSLSEIERGFKEKPPKRGLGTRRAFILVDNVKVRTIWPYEEEPVSLFGFDEGLSFPLFEVRDATDRRVASWRIGSKRYLEEQERWGFNTKNFVEIPRIELFYKETYKDSRPGYGDLSIIQLRNPKERIKEKTFEEERIELIPSFA